MNESPETLLDQGWRDKTIDWFKKNSSIILAFVIIFVLAGGIYAYTSRNRIEPIDFEELDLTKTEIETPVEIPELNPELELETEPIIPENLEIPETPAIIDSSKNYVETAKTGDGITHLARKALVKYLSETNSNSGLTKEHKVYIEDYIQNKTGDRLLEAGETINFSVNLIQEAVEKSQNLTPEQLEKIAPFAKNINL